MSVVNVRDLCAAWWRVWARQSVGVLRGVNYCLNTEGFPFAVRLHLHVVRDPRKGTIADLPLLCLLLCQNSDFVLVFHQATSMDHLLALRLTLGIGWVGLLEQPRLPYPYVIS